MTYQDMHQEYIDFNSEYDYQNMTEGEDREEQEESE